MSSNTTKLNLYKKNPVTDGNDTFNIETMLNENWDRIDQKVATLEDVQQSEANANDYTDLKFSNIEYPVTSVNGQTGDVVIDSSSAASDLSITDAGDYYTATNAEGALQEIGQTLNAMRGSLVASAQNILGS